MAGQTIIRAQEILTASPVQHQVARAILSTVDTSDPGVRDTPEGRLYATHADLAQMFYDDAMPLLAAWGTKTGWTRPMNASERTTLLNEMLLLRRACELISLDRSIGIHGPNREEAEAMDAEIRKAQSEPAEDEPEPEETPVIALHKPAFDAQGKVKAEPGADE